MSTENPKVCHGTYVSEEAVLRRLFPVGLFELLYMSRVLQFLLFVSSPFAPVINPVSPQGLYSSHMCCFHAASVWLSNATMGRFRRRSKDLYRSVFVTIEKFSLYVHTLNRAIVRPWHAIARSMEMRG